jgi:anti-sigma B factor antagonist
LDPNAALELPFELTIERNAERVTLTLRGEFDLSAKEYYEEELAKLAEEGLPRLVVDLRALSFIDSTGIKLLLRTLRDFEAKGVEVGFVQGEGQVSDLLEMTGIGEQLPFVRASALE